MAESKRIEYMCTWCGRKCVRFVSAGRPEPGVCPKRPKCGGMGKPHVWVVNRKR